MNQSIYLSSIPELENDLVEIISITFRLDSKILPKQISKSLQPLINKLNKDIYFLIETPYVDRLYRDSYYIYYSSKYGRYSRDCLKVSLFKDQIDQVDFRSKEGYEKLKDQYLGFFVVRPTEPDFLGRNIISPKAFADSNFEYCSISVNSTVNGLKFNVTGFPHSSQDGETYSCAETTLWATMEYFGVKYSDYSPLKPSQIHQKLKNIISERQIPSRGLTITQISFVLKEIGFGCRIYSLEEYKQDFYRLLSCYVESGIPLIIGMDDIEERKSRNIGHAVIAIGQVLNLEEIKKVKPNTALNSVQAEYAKNAQLSLYDLDDTKKEFVLIDDNFPPYRIVSADNPIEGYAPEWANVKIKQFVAPLYPKIYLEAFEAKNFVYEFLLFGPHPLEMMQQVYIKFYLTSSRSFKHNLAMSNMEPNLRDLILEKPMPKFVWIAELASKDTVFENQRNGIIVIDATEPSISDNKPLLIAAYQNAITFFEGDFDILKKINVTLHPFKSFLNNLTPSR